MSTPSVLIVIPARYGSSRLPRKPLAEIHGKPMIQWVYESSKRAQKVFKTLVATDDERIARVVQGFGGEVILTSSDILSGTDRVVSVAHQIEADIYVNVQGDEPLIEPQAIEQAVALVSSGQFSVGTVMTPIRAREELDDPSVVKVITDSSGKALYFSRLPIPYSRGRIPSDAKDFICKRHVGLYVFDRKTLLLLEKYSPSEIEQGECLEQLRLMENGIPIGVVEVDFNSIGVDTQADLEKVREVMTHRLSV